MKTKEFLNALRDNQHLDLVFSYNNGHEISPGYHITEVKNILIDSVDCGGKTDQWRETVIQLWESPNQKEKEAPMTGLKALGILNKVDRLRPMDLEAELKFEYGNQRFHTAHLAVANLEQKDRKLIVSLREVPADCKAKSECGVPEPAAVAADACCDPGSGCC